MGNRCKWILSPARKGKAALYCDRQIRTFDVIKVDGVRVRRFHAYCKDHMARATTGEVPVAAPNE